LAVPVDDRIRRIKKRKKKQEPIDVGVIVLSAIGSTVGCVILGMIFSWLRWLILVSASMCLFGGAALMIYLLYSSDDHELFSGDSAPRTVGAGLIFFMGLGQLFFYIFFSYWFR
jgi:hypothetical protein